MQRAATGRPTASVETGRMTETRVTGDVSAGRVKKHRCLAVRTSEIEARATLEWGIFPERRDFHQEGYIALPITNAAIPPATMTQIADTLVVLFTRGMSLREWATSGMLSRELAIYRRLLDVFGRVVFVTYGDRGESRFLDESMSPSESGRMAVCGNEPRLPIDDFEATLPTRLEGLLKTDRTVVVKSNQMSCFAGAVGLVASLGQGGRKVALVARGGYLWSWLAAHTMGPDSAEAVEAAMREGGLCRAAAIVVGTTQEMVNDLSWRYTLNADATRVVPNYVVIADPPTLPAERERNLVLYAGQLAPVKRVHLLIEAIAIVKASMGEGPVLEIIGAGPERERLVAHAKTLEAPVVFRERIPHQELVRRMARCAVYVQASETEGHPKTVIEAMATGAPVIVADTPGLGDVVTHGATGLRLPAEPRVFAHAIESLLGDEDWRELLGSAAATAARSQYSLDRVVAMEIEAHRAALVRAGVGEGAPVAERAAA